MGNTSFSKHSSDDLDTYAKTARKVLNGLATGDVFTDKVVSIDIRYFSGHVYNLETKNEYYIGGGIINHNCRCVKIPHYEAKASRPYVRDDRPVKKIPKSERKDKIGQTTKGFKEWFASLPEEDKRKWLGKGRYDLYKQDKLTLADLTTGNGRIVTLKELEE